MAQTFLQALVSYFHNHNVLKTTFRVGPAANPWVDGATPPEELYSALPLCTIEEYREPKEEETGEGVYIARPTFTLAIWAEGLAVTEARAQEVIYAFDSIEKDPRSFPITGRIMTGFNREDYMISRSEMRRPTGDWVYLAKLPYRAGVRRELVNG